MDKVAKRNDIYVSKTTFEEIETVDVLLESLGFFHVLITNRFDQRVLFIL